MVNVMLNQSLFLPNSLDLFVVVSTISEVSYNYCWMNAKSPWLILARRNIIIEAFHL